MAIETRVPTQEMLVNRQLSGLVGGVIIGAQVMKNTSAFGSVFRLSVKKADGQVKEITIPTDSY